MMLMVVGDAFLTPSELKSTIKIEEERRGRFPSKRRKKGRRRRTPNNDDDNNNS